MPLAQWQSEGNDLGTTNKAYYNGACLLVGVIKNVKRRGAGRSRLPYLSFAFFYPALAYHLRTRRCFSLTNSPPFHPIIAFPPSPTGMDDDLIAWAREAIMTQ